VGGRGQVADRRVRPAVIEGGRPAGDRRFGVGEREEQRLVEELVAHAPVEALDESVLGRLPRLDVMPIDLGRRRPADRRVRGELGSVVGNNRRRPPAPRDQIVEFANHALAGDRGVGDPGRRTWLSRRTTSPC